MEQEEFDKEKEIEWLVGSIKRDNARAKSIGILCICSFILMVGLVIYCFTYDINDPAGYELLNHMGIYIDKLQGLSLTNILYLALLGALLFIPAVSALIAVFRIEKIDDAREILRINDQQSKVGRVCEYVFFITIVAYIIVSPSTMKMKFVNVIILLRQLLFAKMDVKDIIWWLLAIVVTVCMIVMGDVVSGCIFVFFIVGIYLFIRYTGLGPKYQGDEDIKQLRELVNDGE